jgi:hypothetical protein
MRNAYDQLFKDLAAALLARWGRAQPGLEISSASQEADLVFEPSPGAKRALERELGLFGRMVQTVCLLEAFHQPPSPDEVRECIRKQLALRHRTVLDAQARKVGPPPMLPLWVLSAGKPGTAMQALELKPLEGWGDGVYGNTASLLPVRVVVISELPSVPATLVLRLFGSKQTFRTAHAEKDRLPSDSLLRRVATAVLAELHLSLSKKPATGLTKEEKEIMVSTKADFEAWEKSKVEQGVQQGLQQGVQQTIQALYQNRFGPMPRALLERLARITDAATLTNLAVVVASSPAAEFEKSLKSV